MESEIHSEASANVNDVIQEVVQIDELNQGGTQVFSIPFTTLSCHIPEQFTSHTVHLNVSSTITAEVKLEYTG